MPTTGTKADLSQYIIKFLSGIDVQQIKPAKVRKNQKSLTVDKIHLNTPLLNSGFALNQAASQFFANYFHVKKFTFKKCMAIKMRAVTQAQDQQATVQDLIEIYLNHQKQPPHNPEEHTYQLNHFVTDFCHDPQIANYKPRLKVAAILWHHVKNSDLPKIYQPNLIFKYQKEIKKYQQ